MPRVDNYVRCPNFEYHHEPKGSQMGPDDINKGGHKGGGANFKTYTYVKSCNDMVWLPEAHRNSNYALGCRECVLSVTDYDEVKTK